MSAFVCSYKHYASIYHYIIKNEELFKYNIFYNMSPKLMVDKLVKENIRSVNYRYCGYNNADDVILQLINYSTEKYTELSDLDFIKALDCVDYQSCETKNYYTTKAHTLIKCLQNVVYEKNNKQYVKGLGSRIISIYLIKI